MSAMHFHFVATAEPTKRYCRQVRLWAWAIRRNAGCLAMEPLTVAFNSRLEEETAHRLREEWGANVLCRPRLSDTHQEANKFNVLFAPGLETADWVVLTDCDVVCVSALDTLPAMLGDADFGAVSDGVPLAPGKACWRPVTRYDLLLEMFSGLKGDALSKHVHPDFCDKPPYTHYPYFNGGVLAIRGRVLAAFRDTVIRLSRDIHDLVRMNPVHLPRMLRLAWNDLWYRRPCADTLAIGWHLRPRYADQAAILPALLALGLRYRVLPHAFNWRFEAMNTPGDSPKLLHYYEKALGVPAASFFSREWIESYRADSDPGRRALAEVVESYLCAHPGEVQAPAPS